MARPKKIAPASPTPAVPPRKPGRPRKLTVAASLRQRAEYHTQMAASYLAVAKLEEGRS